MTGWFPQLAPSLSVIKGRRAVAVPQTAARLMSRSCCVDAARVQPVSDRSFPLTEIADASRLQESGGHRLDVEEPHLIPD